MDALFRKIRLKDEPPKFAAGIELGSNAIYGNGLKVGFYPHKIFEMQLGAGYNMTGAKLGIGSDINLSINRFGIFAGAAWVYSAGKEEKFSLPAKFTPEGSATEEKMNAIRKIRVTPAQYISPFLGFSFLISRSWRLSAQANYNKIIKGNEIEFIGPVEYDQPVEPTNESDADEDFQKKAREKLNINGIGASAGIQYLF